MARATVAVVFDDGETFETPIRTIDQIRAERKHGSLWCNEHRAEVTLEIAWEAWKVATGKAEPFDTWLHRVDDVTEKADPTKATPSEPSAE